MASTTVIESALKALITKSKLPDEEKLLNYLIAEDIEDVESFALLCENEHDVIDQIVKKAGYDAEVVKNTICVKKIWRWSRAAIDQVAGSQIVAVAGPSVSVDDESPLNKGVREQVDKAFVARWGFQMPGFRMASESWFNKLYRQLNDKPKRLELVHLENVKLQSAISSNELKGTLVSGSTMTEFKREVSEVGAHHDMWLRLNAVFSTMCLVMSETDGFFKYDELERFIYRMFDLIFRKAGRQRVPVPLLMEAYMVMFAEISEELRVRDTRLGEILERAQWERHFMALQTADCGSQPARGRSRSPRRGHDDARGADNQVQETLRLQKLLQGKVDSQAQEIKKLKEKANNSGGADRDSAPNPKGRGKNGGKNKDKNKNKNGRLYRVWGQQS